MLTEVSANDALQRVLGAFEALGYPRAVVGQWAIPAPDAVDLIAALRAAQPARILEVGTFVGTSALLMLLCFPEAHVHTIDPNFPLEIEFDAMACNTHGADLARRTQEVAAAAAERLGVRERLHLHAGGFSTDVTFAGRSCTTRAIGAEVIAQHGPFDAAFIDGLHFEQAVLSDVRLAVKGVRAGAPTVLHDCIGYWGSCVRRALSRFLEESPEFTLSHASYAELYRSLATLSSARAVHTPSFDDRVRAGFGDRAAQLHELVARALTAQFSAFRAVAADDASGPFASAFSHDALAPRLTIAIDTMDRTAALELDATVSRLAHDTDALLLGLTPPGEAHAASAHSRPLALTVAALDRAGFDAFDAVFPFLEPFTFALGPTCVLPTHTSFLSTTLLALRRGSALADEARLRGLDVVSASDARRIESTRTQHMHDMSSFLRCQSELRALVARDSTCAQITQSAAQHSAEFALRTAQIASLESRLQHMLDWRIHIGRRHYWRRANAQLYPSQSASVE